MKLSTRGRYSLRAMIDLAQNEQNSESPICLKDISLRQGISLQYLEQLFNKLKKANLVKSTRGACGGYYLSKKAELMSTGDIVRAVEGPIVLVDCIENKVQKNKTNKKQCELVSDCAIKILLEDVSLKINNYLDEISLQDLCKISKKIGQKKGK